MSYWLVDHELFLYAKGIGPNDVLVRRCKKPASSSSSSSLMVPMKPEDFDYVETVENHMELVGNGDIVDWDEPDYKRLVKYIYEKRLLVNSQGFVIAEVLHKLDDANEVTIYVRSLDVLSLKTYIPKLRERPIPSRTVKYLGDVNGKVAMMEEDSNITKLTARVEYLEAENIRLESKNNTLDTSVRDLTADLATTTGKVDDLQSKNNTLDTSVRDLTAGLATTTCKVDDLESKNKTLESNVTTLEGKVTKLTADLVTQMNALTTLQTLLSPEWMNALTNNEWVGVEGMIGAQGPFDNLIIIGGPGTFTVDDNSTNVRAKYWYKMNLHVGSNHDRKVVSLEDITPNKERVRFSKKISDF